MANHFSEYDAFNLPPEFRPLGAWAYFGLMILFSIPLLGFIFLIVFSLSDANINRRNFARAYFCGLLVCAVLFAVLFFTGALSGVLEAAANGELPQNLTFLPWVSA
ncbi:MAG: hypothetical protein Q4A07_07430 [Coriobacteriales bacterium]|nr:hypothetical protein [Coriobacteriales bacterium]